ncbi:phage tail length tape measure family protein [Paracoccus denitrificans]|uniref:phage tail length tape measure family protein n=1 Tax=Paracoccus denitrificans TaxID=266 RepID=UPI001E2831CB|nr:phage tail length tape measure family protein [Paracoccus denitrificans]UFS66556.1 phage tail length tape measure family protein [Paracoccus denitrificans]
MSEPDLVISAGFSDAQLVKEANKVVAMYAKKGEEAQKAFQDAQGRVTDTQALKAHMRELDKLSKTYDPVYRAAKQYEAEVKKLDRALDVGAVTQAQYTAKVAEAARQMKAASGATEQVSRGFSGQTTMQIQNAAFQIGDFAVQVASGTSASRALAQQMPQLLGGFGALGAVLGAVVAIGVPVVTTLVNMGEAAEKYEDALKGLREAQSRLNDSIALASMPLHDMFEAYGAAAGKVREMAEAQLRLNIAIARGELSKSIDGIRQATEEYTRLGVGFSTYERVLDAIERDFGLTGDAADDLNRKLHALNDATTNQDRLTQFQELASWLEAAGVPLEKMPPEFARAAANMLDLNINAEQLNDLVNDATRAANGAASAVGSIDFSNAISGADALSSRLAGIIGQARTALSVLGQAMQRNLDASSRNELLQTEQKLLEAGKSRVQIEGELAAVRQRQQLDKAGVFLPVAARAKVIDDARAEAEAAQTATDAISRLNAERAKAERDAAGGGRKGKGRAKKEYTVDDLLDAAERDLTNLQRQFELLGKNTEQAEALRAKWQLLDEAKRRGLTVDESLTAEIDRQSAAIGKMAAEYEKAAEAADFYADMNEQARDGFIDAIVEGESLAGVLGDVAKAFAKAALQAALFGKGPLSGGMGGMLSFLPGFSSGGYTGGTGRNQVAGVVHGGEYVMSAPAVQRIGLENLEALHKGGSVGSQPKITINNNAPGAVVSADYVTKDEVILTVSQAIASNNRRQSDQQYLRGGR